MSDIIKKMKKQFIRVLKQRNYLLAVMEKYEDALSVAHAYITDPKELDAFPNFNIKSAMDSEREKITTLCDEFLLNIMDDNEESDLLGVKGTVLGINTDTMMFADGTRLGEESESIYDLLQEDLSSRQGQEN